MLRRENAVKTYLRMINVSAYENVSLGTTNTIKTFHSVRLYLFSSGKILKLFTSHLVFEFSEEIARSKISSQQPTCKVRPCQCLIRLAIVCFVFIFQAVKCSDSYFLIAKSYLRNVHVLVLPVLPETAP